MPEPGREDNRSLYLFTLGVCLALALLLGWIAAGELGREAQRRGRDAADWAKVWGEQYDPALPAWAYSERQRTRWGLSLAAEDGARAPGAGTRLPGAPPWTRQRERRAFTAAPAPGGPRIPASGGEERCTTCHRFSAPSALPDPLLILADSARAEDRAALDAAAAHPPQSDQSGIVDPAPHPGAWLEWHAPARFGCTSCHGGVGGGLTLAGSGHRGYIPPPGAARANPHRDTTTLIRSAPELWAGCGRCHPGDAVPANPLLSEGRQLARWLNCAGCHETGPNLAAQPPPPDAAGRAVAARAGKPGPPLAGVGRRLNPAWLADYPNRAHEYAARGRMPQYALGEADLAAIAAYLGGLEGAAPGRPAPPAGNSRRGQKLAEAGKCLGCHSLGVPAPARPGDWPAQGASIRPGPALADTTLRFQPGAVERILADPAAEFPGTRMPQFTFDAQQRADLAAWLAEESGGRSGSAGPPFDVGAGPPVSSEPALRARGGELLATQGCSGCHIIPGVGQAPQRPGPSLLNVGAKALEALPLEAQPGGVAFAAGLLDYFTRQLETPEIFSSTPAAMPHFALSPRQRAVLAIALLAEREAPPAEYSAAPAPAAAGADYWPWPIEPQGAGPEWLSPLERSLDPRACAQCHPKQYREWSASRHALAMSPGITGQIIEWARDKPGEFYDCLRCHARLSEQLPLVKAAGKAPAPPAGGASAASQAQPCAAGGRPERGAAYVQNPAFRPGLAAHAHGCANCHLRAHTRYGSDKPRQEYPWERETLRAHPLKRQALLRQSELCRDCHQFDPALKTVNGGPPLENTYEEWRAWAATATAPQSCQDCHLPEGAHCFKGIHDAEFVRESTEVSHKASLRSGRVLAALTLRNTGNGHHLPTYVTPRIWLQAWLSDSSGKPIKGTWREKLIGRDARAETANGRTRWRDHSDTRIPAGGQATLDYDLTLPAGVANLHLEVYCAPDHFYHDAYRRWLGDGSRSPAGRQLLEQALAESAPDSSGYYIFRTALPIPVLEQIPGP